MMFHPIHRHLLLTTNVDRVVTSPAEAKAMLLHLVDSVGMVAVTEPQAFYVKTPGNEGLTGSINLATSHIAFHIWDNDKKLVMDLYSCKDFDVSKVMDTLSLYFINFSNTVGYMLDRDTYKVERVL